MEEFNRINVTHGPSIELMVDNPTKLKLVDKGAHGAVFLLSEGKCVKIYADTQNAALEANSYKLSQASDITPRLYETGNNYIIMEFIEGVSLWKYLFKQKDITFTDSKKLVKLLKKMKKLGFTRRDSSLRHILVTAEGELKVIDLVYAYVREDVFPYKVFSELLELGLLKKFLKNVKKMDGQLYIEWKAAASKCINK